MAVLARTLITKSTFSSALSRSFSSITTRSSSSSSSATASSLLRFRPVVALADFRRIASNVVSSRCFSSRPSTSSLNDPSPNWNNRPPKETILLDGCDFEHWLIVLEKPEGDPTRDEIIDSYIKTLAMALGSEEEARQKIYSVSTKHYFAFGCIVSEEVSIKIKELPRVRWVLPDSYLDVRNKDYGGEPFINGQAVPYDPKYHEEWVRNNARANERSRRNDRPRNFDRSRNFERRRENMQNRDVQAAPMPNRGVPNAPPPNLGPPGGNFQNAPPPGGNFQNAPPPSGSFQNGPAGGNFQNAPPNRGNMPPNPNGPGGAPYPNAPNAAPYANAPNYSNAPNNAPYNANMHNPAPPPNMPYNAPNMQYNAGPNAGYSNNPPGPGAMPYRDGPSGGGGYQNGYPPNGNMGGPPGGSYQGRDIPGRDEYQQ